MQKEESDILKLARAGECYVKESVNIYLKNNWNFYYRDEQQC